MREREYRIHVHVCKFHFYINSNENANIFASHIDQHISLFVVVVVGDVRAVHLKHIDSHNSYESHGKQNQSPFARRSSKHSIITTTAKMMMMMMTLDIVIEIKCFVNETSFYTYINKRVQLIYAHAGKQNKN